ncbi:hypothetical protein HCG51_08805 [Tolypothrix sp. PCC 7910]|uniref:hypothetical protein n=1 Tax=Tolypothrix sp. PCC 7910 TaxID=2099387 RepID=UPI0014279B76|nr:hypothetical protein [Tolypothrix sp. PCC 7910]QIR36829.1 hypothetical protein HCG51_08805 [Tolypothrix sp. PCC 7910]
MASTGATPNSNQHKSTSKQEPAPDPTRGLESYVASIRKLGPDYVDPVDLANTKISPHEKTDRLGRNRGSDAVEEGIRRTALYKSEKSYEILSTMQSNGGILSLKGQSKSPEATRVRQKLLPEGLIEKVETEKHTYRITPKGEAFIKYFLENEIKIDDKKIAQATIENKKRENQALLNKEMFDKLRIFTDQNTNAAELDNSKAVNAARSNLYITTFSGSFYYLTDRGRDFLERMSKENQKE